MAKGQMRSNREKKKPKTAIKKTAPAGPSSSSASMQGKFGQNRSGRKGG